MSESVAIEIRPGEPLPEGADLAWHEAMKARTSARTETTIPQPKVVDIAYLKEEHHGYYGRPWVLGKYLFDFVCSRGLRPEHKLLDCGCGSGRFAIRAIPYLDVGNYCGIDVHLKGLLALATYEIPFHGLATKRPRLLLNGRFAFDHFGTQFDWVMDCFVAFHFKEDDQRLLYFKRAAQALRPGGRLLSLPEPRLTATQLRSLGLVLNYKEIQPCPLLEGHDFVAQNEWYEYIRTEESNG